MDSSQLFNQLEKDEVIQIQRQDSIFGGDTNLKINISSTLELQENNDHRNGLLIEQSSNTLSNNNLENSHYNQQSLMQTSKVDSSIIHLNSINQKYSSEESDLDSDDEEEEEEKQQKKQLEQYEESELEHQTDFDILKQQGRDFQNRMDNIIFYKVYTGQNNANLTLKQQQKYDYNRYKSQLSFYSLSKIQQNKILTYMKDKTQFKVQKHIIHSKFVNSLLNKMQLIYKYLVLFQKKCPVFNPNQKISLILSQIQLLFNSTLVFYTSIIIFFDILYQIKQTNYDYSKDHFWNKQDTQVPILLICILDIFKNCSTGYYQNGQLIMERSKITIKYFKQVFFFDILGMIPTIINPAFSDTMSTQLRFTLNLLIFFRFISLKKVYQRVNNSYIYKRKHAYYIKLVKLTTFILTWAHIMACIYHSIAILLILYKNADNTWLNIAGVADSSVQDRYLYSFFVACGSMITVMVYLPETLEEIGFIAMIMIFNCGFFGYSINSLGIIMQEITLINDQQEKETNTLMDYMIHKKLHKDVQLRIKNYLQYVHTWESGRFSNEMLDHIIPKLSQSLQDQLVIESNKQYIEYFRNVIQHFPQEIQQYVIEIMEEEMYSPGEIIYGPQKQNYGIYIMLKGDLKAVQNSNIIYDYKEKQMFGVTEFFTGQMCNYTVKSTQFTTIMVIKRDRFMAKINQINDSAKKSQLNQIFQDIRDRLIYQQDFAWVNQNCLICSSRTHQIVNCSKVHYIPKVMDLQTKLNTGSQNQRRQKYFREQKPNELVKTLSQQERVEDCMILYMDMNQKFLKKYESDNYLNRYDVLTQYFLQIQFQEEQEFMNNYYSRKQQEEYIKNATFNFKNPYKKENSKQVGFNLIKNITSFLKHSKSKNYEESYKSMYKPQNTVNTQQSYNENSGFEEKQNKFKSIYGKSSYYTKNVQGMNEEDEDGNDNESNNNNNQYNNNFNTNDISSDQIEASQNEKSMTENQSQYNHSNSKVNNINKEILSQKSIYNKQQQNSSLRQKNQIKKPPKLTTFMNTLKSFQHETSMDDSSVKNNKSQNQIFQMFVKNKVLRQASNNFQRHSSLYQSGNSKYNHTSTNQENQQEESSDNSEYYQKEQNNISKHQGSNMYMYSEQQNNNILKEIDQQELFKYEFEQKQMQNIPDFDVQQDYVIYLPHNNLTKLLEKNKQYQKLNDTQEKKEIVDVDERIKDMKKLMNRRKSKQTYMGNSKMSRLSKYQRRDGSRVPGSNVHNTGILRKSQKLQSLFSKKETINKKETKEICTQNNLEEPSQYKDKDKDTTDKEKEVKFELETLQ